MTAVPRPEEELNRLLRRVDWRFLLETPRPRRVFCQAGGALADAVATIAGEMRSGAADGDCDLSVGEDPDREALAGLYDALRPGGACYTEWSPRPGAHGRVARALGAAGFVDVSCYRLRYGTDEVPAYWIPLGAPGAAAYVSARLRLRGGRVRRLLAEARRRLRGLARGHVGPRICAIARRPEAVPPAGDETRSSLGAEGGGGGLGEPLQGGSRLLVTGGGRTVSKVVLLTFDEPDALPRAAVKAPRVDSAAAGLRREADVLAGLAADHAPPGIPRLLFHREIDGVPFVGETALAGRPLENVLTRRSLRSCSIRVTDWLVALHRDAHRRPAREWLETLVEPALARFREQFGSLAHPDLLHESERIVRGIGDLPAVPEQRDFGPWNLLLSPSGELGVLDWESGVMDGLPGLDLLYYLAHAAFSADGARSRERRIASYLRSLDPAHPTGHVRSDCLSRYLDGVGLEASELAPLRILVWLLHTPSDFRHAREDAGGPPPRAALEGSLFLTLWAEEVRRVAHV